MFASRVIGAICGNYSGYYLRKIAVQYKSALSASLHAKTLALGDVKTTGGPDVATLGEVDSQILFKSSLEIPDAWSYPLQISLYYGGLAYLLPWQAFVAVALITVFLYPAAGLLVEAMSVWVRKNMSAKDYRTELISEAISSIESIKMHAWESVFSSSVAQRRLAELETLRNMAVSSAGLVCLMQGAPSILTIAAFGVLLRTGQQLDSQIVFTAIMLFSMLNGSLIQLSTLASTLQSVAASTERVRTYLNLPETKISPTFESPSSSGPDGQICFEKMRIAWPNEAPLVTDGKLSIDPRSLVVIQGGMGVGKSTLLLSILRHIQQDEMQRHRVAYVPQHPTLINGSIRDNIIFGRPFDSGLYTAVIHACCLDSDFQHLRQGDRTPITGSLALSGGQCARICLARAAYSQADIYLLDDPLSAVDARVSAQIVRRLLGRTGLLANKARVVATSADGQILGQADTAYQFQRGKLLSVTRDSIPQVEDCWTYSSSASQGMLAPPCTHIGEILMVYQIPAVGGLELHPEASLPDVPITQQALLEPRRNGSSHPAWTYILAARTFGWPLSVGLLLMGRTSSVLGTYTLKLLTSEQDQVAVNWDMAIFVLLALGQIIFFYLFILAFYQFCIVPAASKLHNNLVVGILSKSIDFFQTVSGGETLNLFTNDIGRIDGSLNSCMISLLAQYVNLTLTCLVLIGTLPVSILFVIPLVVFCSRLQQTYLDGLRELRHLDVASRSPLLTFLQEAQTNRVLFSAHGLIKARQNQFQKKLQENLSALFPLSCIDLWLEVRLELISIVFQLSALGVMMAASIPLSTLGFVMTFAFQVTGTLSNMAQFTAQFETDAVSLTRIDSYSQTSNRGEMQVDGSDSDGRTWPSLGTVEYKSVSGRHRPGLPLSLKSISFNVKPGEKIAVVGRTGAGKSSMISCLLRMMEQTEGQILIDGDDISDVDPITLRRGIALIPQRPVIFSDSVRQNLDPLGLRSDGEIIHALEISGALPVIQKLAKVNETDDGQLLETQTSLSVGEVQLLAVTRALIQKSPVLILDEATSGMDAMTESVIHQTLFTNFKATTIIAIMHKLELTVSTLNNVLLSDDS
ncbi:uncharacterized protein NECHADRAFT_53003 [Fusarium vanettenii 77-13-4]|uniref:ABC transporter n=1 Tax=Fusarium vanettenii (strain ATCC MYA-4622 / CBS 123669 / FGSC 9596 / NRRL 45880 / 77-13-4) TaxID=660122 RepID=C7ZIT4_FUSV7|nr:uncharacterized protein NECHADRAFT_53003 [Fusarium vanettenii 77-13-4]EEU36141.1 hypothetical protein NECHADRAFT_53003 [Fusarium vanettenii 77-13-4]